jgi:hypothetical protein
MDEATRLIRRARRRKWLWCLGGSALFPIALAMSYLGSIGALCWGQSTGVLSTATTSRIPDWYFYPFGMYLTKGGPGAVHILQFVSWCSWVGDHDDSWQESWEGTRADYEEQLQEISNGEN